MVGRWGLSAGGGDGGEGGLDDEEGLDEGRGRGKTGGDGSGRSGMSGAGGGGGGGGVRGGGSGFRRSSVGMVLVSGRLWVRPLLLVSAVADSVGAAVGLEVTASVVVAAWGSEVIALEISDELPAEKIKIYIFMS